MVTGEVVDWKSVREDPPEEDPPEDDPPPTPQIIIPSPPMD
jgi:hypothetical protein